LQVKSPSVWVQAVKLVFVSGVNTGFTLKQIHNLLIKQKALAEVLNLFTDEFVKLVHHVTQNTDTMLPNVVDHLLHANSLQLLSVSSTFMENLSVQVIVIVFNEAISLSKQKHNINALLNLLGWEVRP